MRPSNTKLCSRNSFQYSILSLYWISKVIFQQHVLLQESKYESAHPISLKFDDSQLTHGDILCFDSSVMNNGTPNLELCTLFTSKSFFLFIFLIHFLYFCWRWNKLPVNNCGSRYVVRETAASQVACCGSNNRTACIIASPGGAKCAVCQPSVSVLNKFSHFANNELAHWSWTCDFLNFLHPH